MIRKNRTRHVYNNRASTTPRGFTMQRWISKAGLAAMITFAVVALRPPGAKANGSRSRGVHIVVNTVDGAFTAGDPGNCDPTTFKPKAGDPACIASVGQEFSISGDFVGTGLFELTFTAFADGSTSYTDFETWTGTVTGHGAGSFVLLEYDGLMQSDGKSTSKLRILEGTGTGDLVGITGEGRFSNATGADISEMTLHFPR